MRRPAFTLIELLVVVGIIGLLISILVPALADARRRARDTKCAANLHVLGHGIALYVNDYGDVLVPGRLPEIDDCNAYADIRGGRKYRPTFLAMMSTAVGVPPFADPKTCKSQVDRFGEPGNKQNYSYGVYVCPTVPEWTDERNGSYGYNYQFLGNSRVFDVKRPESYKNWPVPLTVISHPARTVACADSMGTAASFPPALRRDYDNNASGPSAADRYGNEGFNLDPPRVDPVNGEMADPPEHRTATDPRHAGRASVLWVDGHVSPHTWRQLGYQVEPDGRIALDGPEADNSLWSGTGANVPWTRGFRP